MRQPSRKAPAAPSQNTDAKLLIHRLFQEGRVLAQDGVESICRMLPLAPSTYYEQKACQKDPARLPARAKRDQELREEIRRVRRENFDVYGVRKDRCSSPSSGFSALRIRRLFVPDKYVPKIASSTSRVRRAYRGNSSLLNSVVSPVSSSRTRARGTRSSREFPPTSSRDGFRLRCDTHGGLPHARSVSVQLEHDSPEVKIRTWKKELS